MRRENVNDVVELTDSELQGVAGGGRSQSQCEGDDGTGKGGSSSSSSSSIVFVGGWGSSMYQY